MISVLTPSIRQEGLGIVETGLERQTFDDFEWIIGSPFVPETSDLYDRTTWVNDNFKGGIWTLNRVYNQMIRESRGELIVSIQDHTFFDPDALERFNTHFKLNPNAVISGVGNKYKSVNPLGEMTWKDPREIGIPFRKVPFNEIEFNFCSIPKHLLYKAGGFDERMDSKFFGMDAYDVLRRLSEMGHTEFYIDESIKSYSTGHGRVKDWEEKNGIHGLYEEHVRTRSKVAFIG